jgi:hypothetical protein
MSCALSFVKTQQASRTVHGRGIVVNGGRTQIHGARTISESLPENKVETTETEFAVTEVLNRPKQIVKEDAGIQVTWVYNLKGEWHDDDTTPYPDPDA